MSSHPYTVDTTRKVMFPDAFTGRLPPGGGGGDNGDMERRLSDLETAVERLDAGVRALETDVAVIKSNYATKADVLGAKNSIVMWLVAVVFFAQILPQIPAILRTLRLIQ